MARLKDKLDKLKENLVVLKHTKTIREEDLNLPEWYELKQDYDEITDAKDRVVVSIKNSILFQRRLVFCLTRETTRELIKNDKNWKKTVGLSNDYWSQINYILFNSGLVELVQKSNGKGQATIYKVIDKDILKTLQVNFDEQMKEVVDFANANRSSDKKPDTVSSMKNIVISNQDKVSSIKNKDYSKQDIKPAINKSPAAFNEPPLTRSLSPSASEAPPVAPIRSTTINPVKTNPAPEKRSPFDQEREDLKVLWRKLNSADWNHVLEEGKIEALLSKTKYQTRYDFQVFCQEVLKIEDVSQRFDALLEKHFNPEKPQTDAAPKPASPFKMKPRATA